MASESGGKTRLETWKEVAAFFRKDERTVKRWEAERGLPIHRLPGGARSRIFAVVSELEAWRDGAEPGTAIPVPEESATESDPKAWPWARALTAAGAIGAVALAGFAAWLATGAIARLQPPPLNAQRQFVAASDDWAKRTPASLNRAIGEYSAAIALDPNYAQAYAGLAGAYDLLREYTHVPAAQAYPLARTAAERALALNDHLAAAHAALAFAEYWGFWNTDVAKREFERAIALDPRSATAQNWYATFLSATGEQQEALIHIDAAQALDPASPAVASDRGLILFLAGRDGEGQATLEAVERAYPDFLSAHVYLADYYLDRGRFEDYLPEARRAAELSGDDDTLQTLSAVQRDFVAHGSAAFLNTLIDRQLARFRNGQASAYSVADVYAVSGDQAHALAFLKISLDRRETDLMNARGNEAFRTLRVGPQLASILSAAMPQDAS